YPFSPRGAVSSVHRGVFDSAHTIQHFGPSLQDIDASYPPLWKILRRHGEPVGVFASLHWSLETLRVGDRGLHFSQREGGLFMISAGQENLPPAVAHARLGERRIPLAEAGLENVAIEDHSTSSAYHVPEGMLCVYAGAPARPARPLARTIDIAP